MACGTGVAAAAMVYSQLYLQPLPITVEVPGGVLTVDMSPVSKHLLLQGNADYVFEVDVSDVPIGYDKRKLFSEGGPAR